MTLPYRKERAVCCGATSSRELGVKRQKRNREKKGEVGKMEKDDRERRR